MPPGRNIVMTDREFVTVFAARYVGGAIGLAALSVSALYLLPLWPFMPGAGLDLSWVYALNEAVEQGRVFGRDLIFTFGPLASVYSGSFHPATDGLMMIGSAVFALGFCAAFALLAHPLRHAYAIVLPVFICLAWPRDSIFLILPLALLLAVTRVSLPARSPMRLQPSPAAVLGIAAATCAVATEPFIKGSFVGVTMLAAGLSCLLLLSRDWRAGLGFAILVLCTSVAAWALTKQPLAALPGFFITQMPVISGYTNAMAMDGPRSAVLVYLAGALILSAIFYVEVVSKIGWRGWVALLGFLWVLFVTFKAAFVREHILIGGGMLLLAAYAVSLLSRPKAAVAALVAGIAGWTYLATIVLPPNSSIPSLVMNVFTDKWEATVRGIRTRLADPGRLDRDFAAANATIRAEVPLPSVRGTVDIYPWQLSAIFANGLRWSGRPVFQSYSAYEPSLLADNFAHLRGASAPDTIFFTFSPIDLRLPAMDDSSSLLQLLASYEVVGYQAPYLELAKRAPEAAPPLDEAEKRVIAGTLGTDIPVEETRPVWASLDLHPTFLGRMRAAVYKLPLLHIVLQLDDGRTVDRRYIAGVGNTGFILSPYLEEPQDFLSLAAGLEGAPKVVSFRITTGIRGLWSRRFEVTMTPIRLTPQPGARALVEPPTPAALSQRITSPKAQCHLDLVNGRPLAPDGVIRAAHHRVRLQGWTAPPDSANGPDEAWVSTTALRNGEKHYFRAQGWLRPDVAAYLHRPGMKNPGFIATLDLKELSGPQAISVYSLADGKAYDCGIDLSLQ
jgi:hypothetical protein